MKMDRMIFIMGFARGGTTWLRNCIAFHPEVDAIPKEMVVFRDLSEREAIKKTIDTAIKDNRLKGPRYVNKAPANSPYLEKACRMFPESKFLFVTRDPRDVFVSHKRGKQKWMGGTNSTVQGCMKKTQNYWSGYEAASGFRNVKLVRYEDLHQAFESTLEKIYKFLDLSFDAPFIREAFECLNFRAQTGRRIEDRNAAMRKGVAGDWVNFLNEDESQWYRNSDFWISFFATHGYGWKIPTYSSILNAMRCAGLHGLTEQDLLDGRLDPEKKHILLLHDIDLLVTEQQQRSVIETAEIDFQAGFPSLFNFLPLDDLRYKPLQQDAVLSVIKKVRQASLLSSTGLHLNATERFFPMDFPDIEDNHPDMNKAIAYLHKQVDEYENCGIQFRVATAHGYGRRKKKPNNRDSMVFTEELKKRGIALYDNTLRMKLKKNACAVSNISDVGGSLALWGLGEGLPVDEPDIYRQLPPGTLILMLSHPGNYSMHRPLSVAFRDRNFVRKNC